MTCATRGLHPSSRSRQGELVLDGRRRTRLPQIRQFVFECLQIDPALSVYSRELESAYHAWSGARIDRSGDMHNLCEFLTLWCGAEECEQRGGKDRVFWGVGLRS